MIMMIMIIIVVVVVNNSISFNTVVVALIISSEVCVRCDVCVIKIGLRKVTVVKVIKGFIMCTFN